MKFDFITEYIKKDLDSLENSLVEIADSNEEYIKEILKFIFETKGKRIRPALVYTCCRLFGKVNKSTHNAALVLEMMHTASLLHDDVVDRASLRRGRQTVNSKWDDKTAVLVGDYLFSRSMKIATEFDENELLKLITPVIVNLSLGELHQMNNSMQFKVDINEYYKIIINKTASLISVCCKAGAVSAGTNQENIKNIELFGDILGLMFQIKDDILDYVGNEETGKEKGVDIKEGKITLPFILAWNDMNDLEREQIENYWRNVSNDESLTKIIIRKVIEKGGISKSEQILQDMKYKALIFLKNAPKSDARQALEELVDYIITRNK